MTTKTAAPRKAAKKTVRVAPAKASTKAKAVTAKKTSAPRTRKATNEGAPVAAVAVGEVKPTKATRRKTAPAATASVETPTKLEETTVVDLVAAADAVVAESKAARGRPGRKAAAPAPRPAPEPKADSRIGRSYVIKDVDQAAQWIKDGKTYIEMSDLHLNLHGTRVAPATFSLLRQRLGLPARHVRGHANVPWPLSGAYKHSRVATLLRSWERLQRGMEVSPARQKLIYAWLQENELAQFTEDGFMLPLADNPGAKVVDYDHTEGFTYVKRRKTDDAQFIIRKPSKARVEELRAALV